MILQTTRALAASVLRALTILLLIGLVVLALYVSIGRQLTPRVADYKDWLEQRLSQELGMRVSIGELSGEWLQFSPRFVLGDVRLGDENALQLQRVSLAPSVSESLRQRRLVIGNTAVEALDIRFSQQTDGRWQLLGLTGSGPAADAEMIFRLITRLSRLSLNDTRLHFADNDGNSTSVENARLDLQNNAGLHLLQLQAQLPDDTEPLRVEAELTGATLADLAGQIYLNFPQSDYSVFIPAINVSADASVQVDDARLAGELWLELYQGRARDIVFRGQGALSVFSRQAGQAAEPLRIENLRLAGLHVTHEPVDDLWRLNADDLSFDLDSQTWPQGDMQLLYQPGKAAELQIEAVDAGIVARALSALPVDNRIADEVAGFNPRGQLQHLTLTASYSDNRPDHIRLVSNIGQGAVTAFRGAPSFWGVDGYAELSFDLAAMQGDGFVEVESTSLSMHLPNLFNDIWDFSHVNGRVGFRVDGAGDANIRIASGVIVAESDAVNARGQFATEIQLGDSRYIDLELKLGALQADVAYKSRFLPTAPTAPRSVQGVLEWVDDAVLAGNGGGSGLIFRGRVQRGAAAQERTLQMFYQVTDGTLKFDPAWPALEDLQGVVVVDNSEVDVRARAGSTLGIEFTSSVASVRANPGGGRWLTVRGQGSGSAAQGLQYLQQTPVTAGIAGYFSEWTAEGNTHIDLALDIPLYIDGARPKVSLALDFADNRLFIPEYDLQLDAVSGTLMYTDDLGLRSEGLTATALGRPVTASIVSDGLAGDAGTERTSLLTWTSTADPQTLAGWNGFPSAIKPLLSQFAGEFDYEASLQLPAGQSNTSSTTRYPQLRLRSDLNSVAVLLPAPFAKETNESRTADLLLEFRPAGPVVDLRWQDLMQMNLVVEDGLPVSGLIFLGSTAEGLRVRRLNPAAPGVEVLGSLPVLDYAQWQQSFSQMFTAGAAAGAATSGPVSALSQVRGSAELSIGELIVADENFTALNVSLQRLPEAWELGVLGTDVAGTVVYPLDGNSQWQINLDYLHLGEAPVELPDDPAAVTETAGTDLAADAVAESAGELDLEDLPAVEYELPREDPLAALDPRNFPAMQASIGQLTLSGADFGSWQFELDSDDSGAVFRNLRTTARGLSIGSDAAPAEFRWIYDGDVHRSVLNGQITATDIGPVLSAYGYAPSLQSSDAVFDARLHWDGSPAYFSALGLSGDVQIRLQNGRFQQRAGVANSALRLISIINFDAVIRRLRFSDDFLRSGLSYDEISGRVNLSNGIVNIIDRLQIIGPSSLFQVEGELDLAQQTIDADLFITLPVSDNIPWLGGLAVLNNLINWQLAIGVFLFDQIFGEQVDNLTSAQYTLEGPWDSVEPKLYQVFASGS